MENENLSEPTVVMPKYLVPLLVISILLSVVAISLSTFVLLKVGDQVGDAVMTETFETTEDQQSKKLPEVEVVNEFNNDLITDRDIVINLENAELVDGEKMIKEYKTEIQNPSTGDMQSVRIYFPVIDDNLPVVVMIPGGAADGSSFERSIGGQSSDALTLARKGFLVVVYSPLGTGDSEGDINYQGHHDQDGLAAIIEAVKDIPIVDVNNIGLASFSYGVTGAAGVLSRYPELGIKYWSDWEGPSSRSYTNPECENLKVGNKPAPGGHTCDDDEYWSEREASEFVKTASVDYYWRIQEEDDHVQTTHEHTVEMINNAIGNISWVKLNDDEINVTYTKDAIPYVENDDHFIRYVVPHLVTMSKF